MIFEVSCPDDHRARSLLPVCPRVKTWSQRAAQQDVPNISCLQDSSIESDSRSNNRLFHTRNTNQGLPTCVQLSENPSELMQSSFSNYRHLYAVGPDLYWNTSMFCVLYEGLAKIVLETFDHFATFQMFLTYSFYYLTPFIVLQLKSTTANQININITCEEKNYVLI